MHAGRAATPDKKLSFFEKGCSQGSAASCVEAANILEKSAKTRARAIELLGKACAGSTADEVGAKLCDRYWAAAKQARLLRKPTTAKVVHDRMCRLRMRVPSCLWMAKRSTKPFAAYSIACEAKHAPSCWKAARAARKDPDNKEEEAKAYERGCALGDPIACWKAGKLVKACASGKGSYDACLAKAAKVTNFESHEGDFTGDRDNWCRLACKAWRKRDRRERRASGKNPKRTKVCRKVKRCR